MDERNLTIAAAVLAIASSVVTFSLWRGAKKANEILLETLDILEGTVDIYEQIAVDEQFAEIVEHFDE